VAVALETDATVVAPLRRTGRLSLHAISQRVGTVHLGYSPARVHRSPNQDRLTMTLTNVWRNLEPPRLHLHLFPAHTETAGIFYSTN